MSILHPFFLDVYTPQLGQSPEQRDYFFGYGVSDDAVIFVGTEGWAQRKKEDGRPPFDGRYALISIRGDCVYARTDVTGQEAIFYFCKDEYWAISNSFYLLVKLIKRRGHSLTVNSAVLSCYRLQAGKHISAQLMSNNTLANEIRLLPQNSELVIKKIQSKYVASEEKYFDFLEHIPSNSLEYGLMLVGLAKKMIGQVVAIARHGYALQVSLSAGYDSREILSAVYRALDICPEIDVAIFSERDSPEYSIAEKVASACGLEVKPRHKMFSHQFVKSELSSKEAVNNWLMAQAGVYMPVLFPVSTITENRISVDLWGYVSYEWDYYLRHDSDNLRNPVTLSAGDIVKKISDSKLSPQEKSEVISEFLSFFDDLGVDPSLENAMDIYYMGTRSRHHYGRSWYKGMQNKGIPVGLLAAKEQILLNWYCAQHGYDKRQFHKDLLTLLAPNLSEIEFDSSWKDLASIKPSIDFPEFDIREMSIKVYGGQFDYSNNDRSIFEYGRELSSDLCVDVGVEESVSDIFRVIASKAIVDPDFINVVGGVFVESVDKELKALALEFPAECNTHLTLAVNLYSVIKAINAFPPLMAKLPSCMHVAAKFAEDHVLVKITSELLAPDELEYAYYLMCKDERIDIFWYSKASTHKFNLPVGVEKENLAVIGFIRRVGSDGVLSRTVKINH